MCRSFSSLAPDITVTPYTIWTLYDYDSAQKLESAARLSSRLFQIIALSVIKHGKLQIESN
jgi:hypothetical protein